MMRIAKTIMLALVLFIFGCKEEPTISRELDANELTMDITTDINMTYSDSAKTKITLESPLMETSTKPSDKKTVFPKGLLATFYNDLGQKQSTLVCDFAEELPRKNLFVFRGNVVWKNVSGEKMETEEMFLDVKKNRMYSNKNTFVSFHSKGNIINGYGFEAYDDFKHQKVYNIVNSVIEK